MKEPDPLTLAITPPASETPEQRIERVQKEQKAREVSLRIDEEIKLEKAANKKRKKPIKVLILGQSESGKSTTIKNFQRKLSPQLWNLERASWRAVIFLNLVHSVNTILNVLTEEMPKSRSSSQDISSPSSTASDDSQTAFTLTHKLLKMRLGPLYQIQHDLENLLGTPSTREPPTSRADYRDPFSTPELVPLHREFWVASSRGWKSILDKVRNEPNPNPNNDGDNESRRQRAPRRGAMRTEDVADVIAGCAADIKALWNDTVVQKMLKRHELILEDWAGFFLHDVDRIASHDYMPSDADILHAHLQTMGVQEYRFDMGNEHIKIELPALAREWVMYDVAGIRSSRSTWFPFFDDINCIIFIAPVSAFDQVLAEDERVNRVADSVSLWKLVCASKILKNVQLILLLNKCDVLKRKLKEGRRIGQFVKSFADTNNDYETVLKRYNHIFKNIMTKQSPRRFYYSHFTSVVNAKATAATLASVQDSIIEHMLVDANLIN